MTRALTRNLGLWLGCLGMIGASVALSALFYDRLPDPVPTHWDLHGEADGFTAKPWGAFAIPLLSLAVLVLLAALPALSPKGFRIDPVSRAYRWMVAGCAMLFTALHALALGAALGETDMRRAFPVLFGVFFVVIGNVLPTLRRNFFMGIRTPWTLADEEVWSRTHRWGGRAFVAGGLAMIVLGGAGAPFALTMTVLLVAALSPVLYSFVSYRSLHAIRR